MRRFAPLLLLGTLITPALVAQDAPEPPWETRIWLPPLISLQRAEDASTGYVLWPFISWRRIGAEMQWSLMPLIRWQRNIPHNRVKFDLLWPLIKYDRDGEDLDWRVFPLRGGWQIDRHAGDRDRYFQIFPLLFIQRDPTHSSIVIPPYVRIREGETRGQMKFDALLPFWHSRDEETGEISTSLFPVIWGRRNGELTYLLVFPFYWNWNYANAQFHALLPLWGEYRNMRANGTMRERDTMILPPLWVRSELNGGEETRQSILWPLISWGGGQNTRLFRVLPFFSYQVYSQSGRDYESRDLWVPPVLISRHYQGGQLYERRMTSLLSWWWWGPDLGDRRVHSWGVYPLISGGSTEGMGSHVSVFDPLFFMEGKDIHERLAPLWRLFYHTESADGQSSRTELLWRLFYHIRRGSESHLSIFPFITLERGPESGRTAFLWRFFEYSHDPGGRWIRVLFSPRIRISGSESMPASND
jgi:hypothetical protein